MNRKLIIGGAAAGAVLAAGAGVVLGTGGSSAAGGGYGGYSAGGGYSAAAPGTATGAAVGTANTGLGQVLVDGDGRTLYLFEADPGGGSACNGGCAGVWPPLTTTGTAAAAAGAAAGQLGTVRRADGAMQVTYGGHPLYTFAGDTAPGMTKGQGLDQFGGAWYVLDPSGAPITG